MIEVRKLCVYGVAALSLGVPAQAALAQCGTASWYHEGSRTANGERYRPDGISAAHRSLPFGTRVQVRNQRTGRSITVRINDRGPFIGGRIIDLSRGARQALGMGGLAPVCLAVVGRGPRVASADAGDSGVKERRIVRRVASRGAKPRYAQRRAQTRMAKLYGKKRIVRIARAGRYASVSERNWTAQPRGRGRSLQVEQRARRAALREQRRLRRQAAATLRSGPTDL